MNGDLPDGVVDEAARRWVWADRAATVDRRRADVEQLLWAPLNLEPDWPSPVAPVAVGTGWIHPEVIDADRPALVQLKSDRPELDVEALASLCQQMRLPVTPYRRLADSTPAADRSVDELSELEPGGAAGAVVVDMTTHWAGPLATKLLADAGATVVKVDPDTRPDGFRPRPHLYRHLNGAKQVENLDLRSQADRRRFEALVAGADLVVESFSRRVMGNLGYDDAALAALSPGVARVSIRAHPDDSAERDWLGFGPGVHAVSGLAFDHRCQPPRPAPVAYPDVLAGLTAYGIALRLLNPRRPRSTGEVSLRAAIEPIRRLAVKRHAELEAVDG